MERLLSFSFVFLALFYLTRAQCTSDPTTLNVTGDDGTITFTWNAVTGNSPTTYEFSSTIDGGTPHSGLTATSYEYTGLPAGILYEATARVQATCNGPLSQPLTRLIDAATKPATPNLTVNSDDNTDINLVFEHEGEADTYVILNSFFSGGMASTPNNFYFVDGLTEGKTYTFEGYLLLNGIESERVTYVHKVEEDLVWGMKPLLFALMWIILIVLFVVVILAIILICYCYKRRKARRGDRMSRESTRDLKDGEHDQGDEASSTEDKQAWQYRDPYEKADYRLTETQRKRAFAIAAQKQAMLND